MNVFRIISSLLLTIYLQLTRAQDNQEVALINQLNNFFHFDHNIFLLDSSIDDSNYDGAPSKYETGDGNCTPQSVYRFELANDTITGLESLTEIRSKNPFLIVVLGNPEFKRNTQLFQSVLSIQRLNVRMKIGMFFSYIKAIEKLRKLFLWYYDSGILNMFSAFYLTDDTHVRSDPVMQVFNFDPFSTMFELVNATGSINCGKYFPSQLPNFQQKSLRVPQVGPARTYYDWKLWDTIIDNLNASFDMIEGEEPEGGFDENMFHLVPYLTTVRENQNMQTLIHPMEMDEIVIVVPQAQHFTDFVAYVMRMSSDYLFGYFVITIVLVTLLLTASRHIKTAKILFFQCAADVLNLLMNDNGSINYRQLNRVDVCLIVPLTFAGFIIVNGVLSIFQSYVTLPVDQPQINTIQDLYKSTVPILTPDSHWESTVTKLLEQASGHDGWKDKLVRTDNHEINHQVFSFNTSMSFFTARSAAKILLEVQKRLGITGYHIPTEIYLIKTLLAYSANPQFLFIERVNHIIHLLREAGLYSKWKGEHDEYIVKIVIKKSRGRGHEDSTSDEFPVPAVVFYGWFASTIVFIGELIWKK